MASPVTGIRAAGIVRLNAAVELLQINVSRPLGPREVLIDVKSAGADD